MNTMTNATIARNVNMEHESSIHNRVLLTNAACAYCKRIINSLFNKSILVFMLNTIEVNNVHETKFSFTFLCFINF